MSKKQTTLDQKNPLNLLKEIGPFEKAQNNLQKFVWNVMICHATQVAIEAIDAVKDDDSKSAEITRMTAELTLHGLAQLILEKDGGQWN